jgi:hypothetical protein
MRKNFLATCIRSLIIIAPDKVLLKKIRDALLLIKKTDIKEYKNLFSRLKIIFITNKNGYSNEFFMPEKIWFANKSMVEKNDLNWLASLLIHEAFHATQFKKGKYVLPLHKLEKPALNLQKEFLLKLGDKTAKKDIKIIAKQKHWIELNKDKRSYAYFRNLLDLYENKKIKLRSI